MAAALAVALAGLAACTRPAPVKGTFVLEPPSPPPAARTQPGVLKIGTMTVGAPFRGRQFVYRKSDLEFESDYYNEFLVTPAANIGEATARALAAAKVFATVVPPGAVVEPDWILEGFVDALYGDGREMQKPAAILRITFFLRRTAGEGAVPVWTRTYERRMPFATGSAGAYVAAQNAALGEIVAELARDLAGLSLPK
jgi:uncharacterized lipoprotein YmbA